MRGGTLCSNEREESHWYVGGIWVLRFLRCVFYVFFPWMRIWHCSLSISNDFRFMNNAKHVNNNFFILFFIVFNFQQNKRYPNGPVDYFSSILGGRWIWEVESHYDLCCDSPSKFSLWFLSCLLGLRLLRGHLVHCDVLLMWCILRYCDIKVFG